MTKENFYEITVDGYALNGRKFDFASSALKYLKDYSFNVNEKVCLRKTTIITESKEIQHKTYNIQKF